MNRPKIILTGGGSAGHITVNLALIPLLLQSGWQVVYIGSIQGIEQELISKIPEVQYYAISTGKLRRYFDLQNFTDFWRVIRGVFEAYKIIRRLQPQVVFSKGGFVSVPVVISSGLIGIPVITHESDLTPGLANRINMYFAQKICTTFPETLEHLPKDKGEFIGAIVRPELKQGNSEQGRIFCEFNWEKPVILIAGGSLGSTYINQTVHSLLNRLLKEFQIVHICGKGNLNHSLKYQGYRQFEYVSNQLADLMHLADVVISRAGSNFIFEFLSLRKPMILIPLSKKSSRGDQIDNAQVFARQGFAEVILEEDLTEDKLFDMIHAVFNQRQEYQDRMKNWNSDRSLAKLFDLITNTAN
jgi:UDP-N-acetylglucosamine--N-acetylmuramyl-(pentapeptide) pyrophosphoryl-undecaprenol N-acetylglucosamine transferase